MRDRGWLFGGAVAIAVVAVVVVVVVVVAAAAAAVMSWRGESRVRVWCFLYLSCAVLTDVGVQPGCTAVDTTATDMTIATFCVQVGLSRNERTNTLKSLRLTMATACSTLSLKTLALHNGVGRRNRKADSPLVRRAGQAIPARSGLSRQQSLRIVAQAAASTVEAEQKKAEAMQSDYQMNTLTKWLLQQERSGAIDNELTIVLNSVAVACKQIASLVNRAGISNLTGLQGETNVQGEDQKKLDVVSNEVRADREQGRRLIHSSTLIVLALARVSGLQELHD